MSMLFKSLTDEYYVTTGDLLQTWLLQDSYEWLTVHREIFAVLKFGEFAFFQLADIQNSAFAAEI
jgi:hypothetical protein